MKSEHSGNGRTQVTETPDVSHIRNLDVTHEMSDVHTQGILTFIVGLTVMTIVVYLLMWGMFRVLTTREEKRDNNDPPSPMAMTGKERLPPQPRLQSAPGFADELDKEVGVKESEQAQGPPKPKDPLWEINMVRTHWESILKNGAKDQSGKFVILPIDEAKKELLQQGLPVRTNEPATATSNDLPTAASSGRIAAGGRQ
jgi:hypothetical protein